MRFPDKEGRDSYTTVERGIELRGEDEIIDLIQYVLSGDTISHEKIGIAISFTRHEMICTRWGVEWSGVEGRGGKVRCEVESGGGELLPSARRLFLSGGGGRLRNGTLRSAESGRVRGMPWGKIRGKTEGGVSI